MKNNEPISIIETEELEYRNPTAIEGFPGVGLVGTIASSYIVTSLNLKEVGYIDSDLFPPFIVIHQSKIKHPVRIYANSEFIVTLSEIPLPSILYRKLAETIIKWFKSKNVKIVVSIDGFSEPNRIDLKKINVFAISTDEDIKERLEKGGEAKILKEGFMTGLKAMIIQYAHENDIPALGLLAQAFYNYPDPGAAAATIEVFSRLLNVKIDPTPLLQQADEIRVKLKELMRSTASAITESRKSGFPTYIG